MAVRISFCVVLSTVFISCANTHDATSKISSAPAANLSTISETHELAGLLKQIDQVGESLSTGMVATIDQSSGGF